MRRTKCWIRRALLTTSVLCATCAGLIVLGLARPSFAVHGAWSIAVVQGRLEVTRGSGPLIRQGASWRLEKRAGSGEFKLRPRSSWRPTTSAGYAGGPPGSPSVLSIHILFVPLWPWFVAAAGLTALLWRLARLHPAGHCVMCGYDLRGLPGAKCPECGVAPETLAARIARLLACPA